VRAIMEKSVSAFIPASNESSAAKQHLIFLENKVGTVRKEKDMGKMTDNCTDTKASITVKRIKNARRAGFPLRKSWQRKRRSSSRGIDQEKRFRK